jgi:hypothetical protein
MKYYMTYNVSGYDARLDHNFYFMGSAVGEEFLTKKEFLYVGEKNPKEIIDHF